MEPHLQEPIIKVCGITTLDDALQAIEAGANALGFNFYPRSPRFTHAQEWMWNLPVLKVGIFVGEASIIPGLDVYQIYGSEFPPDVRIWHGVKPGAERLPAEAYVLDSSEGTGKVLDWTLAQDQSSGKKDKIIIAGGLDGSNVAEAIRIARPWGVDSCSRLEAAPGKKDPVKVRNFVTAAREGFLQNDLFT